MLEVIKLKHIYFADENFLNILWGGHLAIGVNLTLNPLGENVLPSPPAPLPWGEGS